MHEQLISELVIKIVMLFLSHLKGRIINFEIINSGIINFGLNYFPTKQSLRRYNKQHKFTHQ